MFETKEVWRKVWYGYYFVSNFGRVRVEIPGKIHSYKGYMPKQFDCRGYLMVALVRPRKKEWLVHRLVASAFIGPCPRGKEVNHKDLNRKHNWVGNLEYVTHLRNVRHALENGGGTVGVRNGSAKLTPVKVREIRRLYSSYTGRGNGGARALAKRFGVSHQTVLAIVSRRNWDGI